METMKKMRNREDKYIIREMLAEHLDEAAALYAAAFKDEDNDFSNMMMLFEKTKSNPDYISLVALDKTRGTVTGYGLGIINRFYFDNGRPLLMVWGLCVEAALQGKGIGSALLIELEKRARENDCDSVWMFTDPKNTLLHRFYESNAYISDNRAYSKMLP